MRGTHLAAKKVAVKGISVAGQGHSQRDGTAIRLQRSQRQDHVQGFAGRQSHAPPQVARP